MRIYVYPLKSDFWKWRLRYDSDDEDFVFPGYFETRKEAELSARTLNPEIAVTIYK